MARISFLIFLAMVAPSLVGCAGGGALKPVTAARAEPPDETRGFTGGNSYYQYLLSKLSSYRGDGEVALNHLERAVNLDPKSSFLEQEISRQQVEANSIDEALAAAKRSLESDCENQDARLLLGKLYSARKQSAEPESEYEAAIRIDPSSEEAHISLAREYLLQKKYDRAIETVKRLKRTVPDSTVASYYLGTIYSNYKKDYPRAIQSFQDVLEDDPDDIRSLQLLGQIY